ncbi:MAG: DciA family protein [Gammaproteobacteria bacterium]
MTKAPTQVGRIVSAFGHLKQLTARAARIVELERVLQSHLPPALVGHVRLGPIDNGSLVLFASSPVWASKLRFVTPQLLADLPTAAEFSTVRSIRVRVRSREENNQPHRTERPRMGQSAGRDIRAQAATIGDERLREALERLARRAR